MDNKEKYEALQLDVIVFENEDIITDSPTTPVLDA